MKCLRWMARLENALCALGFVLMAAALILDVGARLILGRGLVGAAQLGLVGMLVTALFGLGLASDAGEHLRPRVLDPYRPPSWAPAMVRIGHLLTGAFFLLLAWLSAGVAWESWLLEDVTSLLRWPVWLLQTVLVLAFGFNGARFLLFGLRPELAPSEQGAAERPDSSSG